MIKKQFDKPVDRANYAVASLRAIESLIGQIKQLENNGNDLSLLLLLIADNLEEAIEEMHQQTLQIAAALEANHE